MRSIPFLNDFNLFKCWVNLDKNKILNETDAESWENLILPTKSRNADMR